MSEFFVDVDLVESFVVEIQEDLDDKTGIVVGRSGEFDTQTIKGLQRHLDSLPGVVVGATGVFDRQTIMGLLRIAVRAED